MQRTDMRYFLALIGVFAAYVVAGKLGLQLATLNASVTAVWPPTGIAIAALLVLGRRMWPAIFAGALVVNVTTTGALLPSLSIAVGNTLEGLLGAWLIERFANGRHAFLHVATVVRFWLLAAFGATVVSATVGVTTLVVFGLAARSDVGPLWLTWWAGDAAGTFVVAPLLVLWLTTVPRLRGAGSNGELAALAVAVAAVGYITFSPFSELAVANYQIAFLIYPVLVWPVVRFGPRVAATAAAALSAVAVWGAVNHAGPWVRATENQTLLFVQAFMGVAMLTSLVVAAALLERQLAEETLLVTEERLRLAEERKVAARDEFLSVAAHELRTPLTSLRLAVQFFVREMEAGRATASPALAQAAATVASQTERLGILVSQLLDTVRIQTDRMDLVMSEEDVVALATRAAQEAQATTTRHEIVVEAPGPVTASVDPIRLEQVVRNLLDNAVKFSPGGRVDLDVAIEDESLLLHVRDRGPGIPLEHRAHVFDRFYQARPDRSGGLGLGLHVSRHIVELHGGAIAADFPPDGGTRIVVRLPRHVAPHPAEQVEEAVR